jgi:hypothetical protein
MWVMANAILSRPKSKPEALEDAAERWCDWLDARAEEQLDFDEDGEELSPIEIAAFGLAGLQRATDVALLETDQKISKIAAALNGRVSVLVQQVRELEADRERQGEAEKVLRARIGQLEAEAKANTVKLQDVVRAIADLGLTIARDRSYVRMINERRYAPIAETSALEAAKRRTDAIIRGEAA